ncbi:MAG TPA: pyridoxamine 5'-phosphate oxidase family protein [Candidatus Acidoferrum sp.]|nr:pyridoxamine 5'-phosphate oxidase family protein [Candidatus Acidoferrum sp.]
MDKTYAFLKACGAYYLATMDGSQPRVRPFGTIHLFEGKLYIQTGKVKDVSMQMHKNPQIEICAFADGKWVRVAATAVEDPRIEAQKSMLEAYPELRDRYAPGDGNTEVWYLKDAVSTFSSFGGEPAAEKF